ncbi:MAG: hypothetical protein ACTSQJ_13135 [Promethearchaeota archaeon]
MSAENQEELRPLIIDIGSATFRMGWAGNDFPDIVVPSLYAHITDYLFSETEIIDGLEEIFIEGKKITNKFLYGLEALKYQNILKIHEFKKESNFNIILRFFHYYYQQLNIAPENHYKQPIILIVPFFITDLEKTKLQYIFLKNLNFPSILFLSESQAILSAIQKTSGVIVSMGESNTYISTIFHGFTNIMARDLFPIAGKELTNFFLNMLLTNKVSKSSISIDMGIAKEIKEKTSLCILDPEGERKRVNEGLTKYNRKVNLPDGSSLEINSERFMVSEPLFNPKLIHIDYIGLPEAIFKVIQSWDRENWEELVPNIILAGGGSLIPGLKERLKSEISSLFSEKIKDKINVIAVNGREHMGWIGASILYSKDQLKKGWIRRSEVKQSQNQNAQQE